MHFSVDFDSLTKMNRKKIFMRKNVSKFVVKCRRLYLLLMFIFRKKIYISFWQTIDSWKLLKNAFTIQLWLWSSALYSWKIMHFSQKKFFPQIFFLIIFDKCQTIKSYGKCIYDSVIYFRRYTDEKKCILRINFFPIQFCQTSDYLSLRKNAFIAQLRSPTL